MKALIDRILKEGKCYEGGILKVDKFINHQMDPNLMKEDTRKLRLENKISSISWTEITKLGVWRTS